MIWKMKRQTSTTLTTWTSGECTIYANTHCYEAWNGNLHVGDFLKLAQAKAACRTAELAASGCGDSAGVGATLRGTRGGIEAMIVKVDGASVYEVATRPGRHGNPESYNAWCFRVYAQGRDASQSAGLERRAECHAREFAKAIGAWKALIAAIDNTLDEMERSAHNLYECNCDGERGPDGWITTYTCFRCAVRPRLEAALMAAGVKRD
jgi:hypothetical protein